MMILGFFMGVVDLEKPAGNYSLFAKENCGFLLLVRISEAHPFMLTPTRDVSILALLRTHILIFPTPTIGWATIKTCTNLWVVWCCHDHATMKIFDAHGEAKWLWDS
jgi:hypothetical protein